MDIPKPHILYGRLSDIDLKDLIKETSSGRKKNSAGRDLKEMRDEYYRRKEEGLVRRRKNSYNKDIMLERPIEGQPFKKGKFVAGMAPKQEKFCMEYMATGAALVAYKAAGYKEGKNVSDTRRRAYALLSKPKINQRIKDIREEAMTKMAWNADRVMDRLDEVYQHSLSNSDYTNANRAVESVAKHLGMFVERSEQKINMAQSLDGRSDKESVQKDIEKLAEIAGLKVISGGKDSKK